jgi:very-short-patch-repair endonuclease
MLAGRGLMTLRFENDDVRDDVDAVCARILAVAKGRGSASPLVGEDAKT